MPRMIPRTHAGRLFGGLLVVWGLGVTPSLEAQAPEPTSDRRSDSPESASETTASETTAPETAAPETTASETTASPSELDAAATARASVAAESVPPDHGQADDDAERGPVHDLATLLSAAHAAYPALQADTYALEAAEARLREAWISPFFQWTGTAGATVAPEASGTALFRPDPALPLSNPWQPAVTARVSGAIPLFTFGKLRAAWRAASAGVRAAELQRDVTRARVAFDVRRAYFGLQLVLDTQQMLDEGMPMLEQALEHIQELLDDDDPDVNETDLFRLEAAMAELRARASQAEMLRRSSSAALRALTGLEEVRVPECPMEPVSVELESVEAIVERAQAERPELGQLDAALDAQEANLAVQRGAYGPDIAFAFSAGATYSPGVTNQTNPFVNDPANQTSLGGGLVLQWNLDFGGNTFRVRRAAAELEQRRAQAAEARRGVGLEAEIAAERYLDASRREQAWRRGRRSGRSWFITNAQAYDIGALEPKDLIDAVRAYFSARFSHVQAIQELNEAAAELDRVVGGGLVAEEAWAATCR